MTNNDFGVCGGSLLDTDYKDYYRFKRASLLNVNGAQTGSSVEAKFSLPEYDILSTQIVSGSVALLLVSCVNVYDKFAANVTFSKDTWLTNDGILSLLFMGDCRMGKISLDFLESSTEISQNLSRGESVRATSEVCLESCRMKLDCSGEEKHISFSAPHKSNTVSILQQVPVICAAQELGAKDITPYDLNEHNFILSNAIPQYPRLKVGNVIFNYRYYNNMMQRSEVTEDYGCPFCLMKCGSYKGLEYHLPASHDLFHFDFPITEDYQVVYVSTVTDALIFENIGSNIQKWRIIPDGKFRMPTNARKSSTQSHNPNQEHQLVLTSDTPATVSDSRGVFDHAECDLPGPSTTPASNHAVVTRCGPKSRALQLKLSLVKSLYSTYTYQSLFYCSLLQSGQFYHSRTNQPMALEQVYAEQDSEGEVDDDIADLEDQWRLDFVDVSMDKKQMMHLCNSFVRRQRVLANGHIPWACEAFSVKHRQDLAKIHCYAGYYNLATIKCF
ncbi:polycomb group protein EMBRYONIC FLOWER 2-like [Rutidosis leptorrhynchoides]|uniref:polycomb group protein EMBRYONIC FLOWER 2-like n=1 Tax=Rutidosis leptorrhynchoides TaxID=125765 RepID=UPI003A99A4FC